MSELHNRSKSITRRITAVQVSGTQLSDKVPWSSATFGEVLLEPTVIYVKRIMKLLGRTDNVRVKALVTRHPYCAVHLGNLPLAGLEDCCTGLLARQMFAGLCT